MRLSGANVRASTHPSLKVLPDPYIVGKLLPFDGYLDAVRAVQGSAKVPSTSEERPVSFNLPRFDGGGVRPQGPQAPD